VEEAVGQQDSYIGTVLTGGENKQPKILYIVNWTIGSEKVKGVRVLVTFMVSVVGGGGFEKNCKKRHRREVFCSICETNPQRAT
jgi:hypothetical protein